MSFLQYKVWTEQEIETKNLVLDGEYGFLINNTEVKDTKGKLDERGQLKEVYKMLVIDYEFYLEDGQIRKITDWIVFMEGMDWKLRHLAKTTGLIDIYESKTLSHLNLRHKKGFFTIGTKDSKDKTKKINFIKDYIVKNNNIQNKDYNGLHHDHLNDTIPF
jgi:hypothetical protein